MSLPLTLSKSTITYTPGTLYNIPVSAQQAITDGFYTTFPAPWVSQSFDPGIEITVTNNAVSAPIALTLMDKWVSGVDSKTYYYTVAELSTVQPGDTVTETVAGLPVTTMVLVCWYLACSLVDSANGWTVNVSAMAV